MSCGPAGRRAPVLSEREAFSRRIAAGALLGDGAYGTALAPYAAGGLVEELCLRDPRRVEALHLGYIRAGADVVQTNTYAANRVQLAPFGLEAKVYDLNVQGAKLARRARETAGRPVLVAGSIGPLGVTARGALGLSAQEIRAAYAEQVEALLAGGVDLFLVETQSDPQEAAIALDVVRQSSELPLVLNFSFAEGDRTLSGFSVGEVVRRMGESAEAPDLFGVNCSLGPSHALRILRRLRRAGLTGPLAVAPNAGPPMRVGGHIDYLGTPERFADLLPALLNLQARLIGGCCGTDMAYVRALRDARDGRSGAPATAEAADAQRRGTLPPRAQEPATPVRPQSSLSRRLGQDFLYGVELDPPKGSVLTKFLADAAVVRSAGADFVNVGDSPMARVRMAAFAAAHVLQSEVGLETIVHVTTRDRNLAALQADLLAAQALGLQHVLALTGDLPQPGRPGVGVFETDSVGLLQAIDALNRGGDSQGEAVGQPTRLLAGCACDPGAQDLARELLRLRQKIAAGAQFIMTQPLYAPEPLLRLLDRLHGPPDVPLLLGVMPLYSYRHAVFLHEEVPGIAIPEAVREAMRRAGERGLELGLGLAEELVAQLRDLVHGIYIVPSFGRVGPIAALLERLRSPALDEGRTLPESP